jgi:hypothetical protein
VKTIGGCNYEKIDYQCKRVTQFIDNEKKNPDYDNEYEMPYYHWEARLHQTGNDELIDNSQGYFFEFFRGFANFNRAINENKLQHIQLKK